MNDRTQLQRVENPFPAPAPQTAAAVVESQRAVAEVIAAMQVARTFPRDQRKAMDLILNDCSMIELAEEATYDYSRGGSAITGPSIRLLETLARRWGNVDCGVKELGRQGEYSEVMTYAIDLETGFRDTKTFQVRHWRDTKKGGYVVTDERDIYEVVANYAARRKRACLEAIIPPDVKEAAIRQCEVTLKSKVEINPAFVKSVLEAFEKWGVTQEMIEKRIQRKIEAMTAGHAVNLRKIITSLKEQMSQPQDWFDLGAQAEPKGDQGATRTENLAAELAGKKRGATPPKDGGAAADKTVQAGAEERQRPQPGNSAPKGAGGADLETGEITNASVRKAIEAAGSQEALQPIMMDMLRLKSSPEREQTTQMWNAKSKALKDGTAAAKPAPAEKEPAKGTQEQKKKLLADMSASKTQDKLDEVMASCTLWEWDEEDAKELSQRYLQCTRDLEL